MNDGTKLYNIYLTLEVSHDSMVRKSANAHATSMVSMLTVGSKIEGFYGRGGEIHVTEQMWLGQGLAPHNPIHSFTRPTRSPK